MGRSNPVAFRWIVLLVGVVIPALLLRAEVARADGPTEGEVLRIEQRLVCPTCSNLRLDLCELAICDDIRGVIRQRLAAGESDDEIVDYFVDRYGERILVVPPKSGRHLFAWALPIAGALLAVVGAVLMLRRWRRTPAAVQGVPGGADAERIREELERFRDEGAPWS